MATDLPKYQRICEALKEEILGHAYDGAHRYLDNRMARGFTDWVLIVGFVQAV